MTPDVSRLTKRLRYLYKPYSQWSGYHSGGRVTDRYRFFHVGLGKRGFNDRVASEDMALHDKNMDTWLSGHPTQVAVSMSRLDKLIKNAMVKYFHEHGYDKQDLVTSKRAPEVFSESLYPLQSGKQALEAMLDKTLHIGTDGALEHTIAGDVGKQFENVDTESLPVNIIDVSDGSEDNLFDNSKPHVINTSSHLRVPQTNLVAKLIDNESESSKLTIPDKRWWAATALKGFRAPKSYRFQSERRKQIDPVLYFIGLGKR